MMNFFEKYFGTKYPYKKYSQVTVEDFEYGGMENTSCTTLTTDIILDKKASLDYNFTHNVISHELAHQWFGDLVTCNDWSNIWLNEGFATYSEALYLEHSKGYDEFQYYMIRDVARVYFNEACNLYKRPIVTRKYKYPDELFDAHSYQKAGFILHMLRNYLGEDIFKDGLKKYLDKYRYSNADTNDLRQVLENNSGKDLEHFFNQWIYSAGHPEISIELLQDKNSIKITQLQPNLFEFPLEIKVVFDSGKENKDTIQTFNVKATKENIIQIKDFDNLQKKPEWFSIDPYLKILLEIKSNVTPSEMLIKQLKNGITVNEKIQSIRALSINATEDNDITKLKIVTALKEIVLDKNTFWGVASQAAIKLGILQIDEAYNAIKECFSNKDIQNPFLMRSLVSAISLYVPKKHDALNLLKPIVEEGDKSYFVEIEALMGIANSKEDYSFQKLKEAIEKKGTFIDIIPLGAIEGLKKIAKDNPDSKIIKDIATLLINKSNYGNSNGIRESATSALTDFLLEENKLDKQVYNQLLNLLDDDWAHVRTSACDAFGNVFAYDVIKDLQIDKNLIDKVLSKLQQIYENDLDRVVRRHAELSIESIQKPPLPSIMLMKKEDRSAHRRKVTALRNMRMIDPISNIIHQSHAIMH